jgi:DNA-binding response OmpR family regulator
MLVHVEEDVILKFKNFLEEEGFCVDAITDPLRALLIFKPGLYDLVLASIRMPNMNGFELVQNIKSKDRNIKVCFITEFEGYYTSLVESIPNLDFKCYIKKPSSKKELVRKIQEIFQLY